MTDDINYLASAVESLEAENERLRQRIAELEALLIESERAETTADEYNDNAQMT